MTVQELEQVLVQAKANLAALMTREHGRGECLHDWLQEQGRLNGLLHQAERALSAARREEHAEVWDLGPSVRWNILPRVFLRSRNQVTVLAVVQYLPPEWRGKVVGDLVSYGDDTPVARIDFEDAQVRWSKPGFSQAEQHSLLGRGLDPVRAMRIANSAWAGRGKHHLIMFENASLEVRGSLKSVEVWCVTLDEAAFRCDGRPLTS